MNLYIRLIIYLIKSLFRSDMDVLETSHLSFHVWPNDLDFNMHMNNGRYLTIMDLGRFDLMTRTGLMKKALAKKYAPILGSAKIRYRLPLKPFQGYDLQTQLICWDEKWVYIEQRFVILKGPKAGAVAAIALVKASLYDSRNKRTVKPIEMLKLIDQDTLQSPPMPEYVVHWVNAEDALKAVTAK